MEKERHIKPEDLKIKSQEELKEAKEEAGVKKSEEEALLDAFNFAKGQKDYELLYKIGEEKKTLGIRLDSQLKEAVEESNPENIKQLAERLGTLKMIKEITPEKLTQQAKEYKEHIKSKLQEAGDKIEINRALNRQAQEGQEKYKAAFENKAKDIVALIDREEKGRNPADFFDLVELIYGRLEYKGALSLGDTKLKLDDLERILENAS